MKNLLLMAVMLVLFFGQAGPRSCKYRFCAGRDETVQAVSRVTCWHYAPGVKLCIAGPFYATEWNPFE